MADFLTFSVYPALGGLVTSVPQSLLKPDQLSVGTNIEYDTSGIRKKRLGTARYSAQTAASEVITSMAEFWRHGTGISPTQKFVACIKDKIRKDDLDGVWDDLSATGWTGGNTAVTNICISNGFAIFSSDQNDKPRKWDQTTLSDLTGTGNPKFEGAVPHLRRIFTFGEQTAISGNANPSRSTFCAAADVTDFTGADTGNIVFDDDDGDRLKGISQSFQGRLYFFKGPNRGSVHELSGLTPATFNRVKVVEGAPCVSHKSIITTPNDIYWVSRTGVHSLRQAREFGDVEASLISTPIQDQFRTFDSDDLKFCAGFFHPRRNMIGWAFTGASQSANTETWTYNLATKAWAKWTFSSLNAASFMVGLTPTTQVPRLYIGGYNGYSYSGDQTTLSDENADQAYTATITTPEYYDLPKAPPWAEKQFVAVTTWFKPKNSAYNVTLGVSIDGGSDTNYTISMNSNETTTYAVTPIEGRGRSIKLTYSQAGANQDMEVYGYAIHYRAAENVPLEKP